ncbi:MAG: hypothetical protein ACFFDF_02370 [Candidatus Odinarchaeota archaeon]
MGRTFGIVALIFGIISIPLSIVSAVTGGTLGLFGMPQIGGLIIVLGWGIIAIAIIFGILGIILDDSKGMAIAGLILGIIGLILRLFLGTLFTTFSWLYP